MTERELRAVAEAIWKYDRGDVEITLFDKNTQQDYRDMAQAALTASDSKYVKGLVEALKEMKELNLGGHGQAWIYYNKIIDKALQNLPEDLR